MDAGGHWPQSVIRFDSESCLSSTISACASCLFTAAEELLEIIIRRYERASATLTSNRPFACGHAGEIEGRCLAATAPVGAT
jgi:hypothetical protein